MPGGTAVSAIETARALTARGVDLIGVSAWHRTRPPEPWAPPIETRSIPLTRIALYEAWHRLRRPRVERATGPVDVIHATAMPVPPRSAPLVVTVHDLAWISDPAHFTKRGVSFFDRGLDLVRREADLVVVPSRATSSALVDHGFDADRLRLVPFGVDATPAAADRIEEVREDFFLDRPYVLWTGTIEPRKNLAGLISAFQSIQDDVEVDLVLAGPPGWNEDPMRFAAGKGVRLRALGFVRQEDLAPLYAGAAALCYPSFTEGFGFPVLEAMAQGTPVVTSTGTSTEELAGDSAVLVDPRDPADIAAGLRRVLEDDGLAERLRHAGRARAAEYSWRQTAQLLEDVYAEVIE